MREALFDDMGVGEDEAARVDDHPRAEGLGGVEALVAVVAEKFVEEGAAEAEAEGGSAADNLLGTDVDHRRPRLLHRRHHRRAALEGVSLRRRDKEGERREKEERSYWMAGSFVHGSVTPLIYRL